MAGNMDFAVIVGLICTSGGFLIAWLTFSSTRKKDDKAEGASIATITSDMGYVRSSIEGIDKKLEKQDERHSQLIERMCGVEASVKSAHKRIDEVIEKESK